MAAAGPPAALLARAAPRAAARAPGGAPAPLRRAAGRPLPAARPLAGGGLAARGSGGGRRRPASSAPSGRLAAGCGSFAAGLLASRARRRGGAARAASGPAAGEASPRLASRGAAALALAAGALAAAALLGAAPALAEATTTAEATRSGVEMLPLDGISWESFVNLNCNLIIGIDSVVGSAGVAIIFYTFVTKVLTFPIYQPALKTNAVMRLIKPQVEQIQAQYKDDERERDRLVRSLYEKVDANPINGLLPTIAQLPVFVALYSAIRKLALEDEHFKEPFLWIPSLSGPAEAGSPSLDWFFKSRVENGFEPLVGWQNAGLYLILPVVLVVVQLFFARLSTPNKEPDAVTLAFPFVIGISTLVSPQGLGIYWLTNSVLSLAQTQLARTEADSEFPELKEIWDTYADKPEEVRQGDKVVLNGRQGVVVYGPDTDNECKVQYEDGSESGFVKAYALRRRGSKLDKVVSELEKEANDPEVRVSNKPKSRAMKRKEMRQQKGKRRS